jgi:hypothetical protein
MWAKTSRLLLIAGLSALLSGCGGSSSSSPSTCSERGEQAFKEAGGINSPSAEGQKHAAEAECIIEH